MKRSLLLFLALVIVVWGTIAGAQQGTKVPRIGFLVPGSTSSYASRIDAFRHGLRELGYDEAKNIVIEYKFADGKVDRLRTLASELVRLKVDIIVVGTTSATTAAKEATSTIPIVVGVAGDLMGPGLITSLARPGGNITGSTLISPDLSAKRLELLKEVFPKASRVAVLMYPGPGDRDEFRQTETAAGYFGVKLQPVEVRDPQEFEGAYAVLNKQQTNALIIIQGSFTLSHRTQLVELAVKHRLPSMCETSDWTEDGCLVSYGPDVLHMYHRAAVYVDKILKGTKPADLPVEQPKKFEFIINLKTAKQIGLAIPPNVLARADKVIR